MKKLEKEFVPYELSVKLKELGFDEYCLAYFKYGDFRIPDSNESFINSKVKSFVVCAPLWQQAFDWFRIKHNLLVYPVKYIFWRFEIDLINPKLAETENLIFDEGLVEKESYEEARQACLEKLITLIL